MCLIRSIKSENGPGLLAVRLDLQKRNNVIVKPRLGSRWNQRPPLLTTRVSGVDEFT